MRLRHITRPAIAGFVAAIATAAAAQGIAALAAVQPGEYSLVDRSGGAAARTVCVRDPRLLLQIGHGKSQCDRFVVADGPRAATIRYVCPGLGNGQTTLTVESESTVRVQTQGIAGGAPFAADYRAHRTGPCAGGR